MKQVFDAIAEGEERLSRAPFVRRLERTGDLDDAAIFAAGLTFFTMAFQDILRLCDAKMEDAALKAIVNQHCREERGHEVWFLSDMAKLGTERDVAWVFGREHQATRDATYELVSDVCRAKNDYVRLSVFLVLEATGDVFFSRVHGYMRSSGCPARLDYFSARHHEIEQGHSLLESKMRSQLASAELAPAIRDEALAVVARAFEAFETMFAAFEAQIEGAGSCATRERRNSVSETETTAP